ncbi:hypothetical protein BC835DRAFT_1424793 [Cytidiella melzeri]|nr:hypothetical protein BC835DRAFT_1424793 [Cytidiella melzeri]
MGAQKAASKAALPPSSTTRISTPITPAVFNVSNVMTQPLPGTYTPFAPQESEQNRDSRVVTARPFETPQRSSVKRGAKREVTEMNKQAGRGFQANPIASSSQSQHHESYTGAAYADSQWQRSFSWPVAQPGSHIFEFGELPYFPPVFMPPSQSTFSLPNPTPTINTQTSFPLPHPSHTIQDIPINQQTHPSGPPESQSLNRFSRWTHASPFGPNEDNNYM